MYMTAEAEKSLDDMTYLSFLVTLATTIVFLLWIYRASQNLHSLGALGQRFSPGWAVGWWFVPIMNLFRPYQVVKEVWKVSDPELALDTTREWTTTRASPLLAWWWASWLVSNVLGNAAFRAFFRSDSTEELISADQVSLAADAATLVAVVLAIIVVRRITKRQGEKYYRMLAS